MENVAIVPVVMADHYEIISAMMRGLHINEKELYNRTALWEDIASSYMRHVINMQEECDGVCLVAYVNDVPAGFIFGYIEEQDDSRIDEYIGEELYVSDGYMHPEYRRKGIYKMLNNRLEQHFSAMDIKRITRYTMANNGKMRSFLEKEGYNITRVVYEKWL